MRFIHSADWQLGKPFGRFDSETRSALTEARYDAIDAIGKAASASSVKHIVVAGDIFDTEGPTDRTIVQALSRMKRYDCHWWLLPGNHDFSRNGGLWSRVERRAEDRIHVLSEPQPKEIEPGVWLMPAPLQTRHTVDDPTAHFDAMETPGARIRIGLAHGSVVDFGSQGDAKNLIAPDRAARSNLDYLALGDWHGKLQVNERTWYSGAPEVDRFQRDEPGYCLQVELQPDQTPQVTPIRTGRFQWIERNWTINDSAAFKSECETLLKDFEPSTTLLKLTLAGMVSLTERVAMLTRLEDDLRHQLRYLGVRDGDLVARPTDDDLASLQAEGILGQAAALLTEKCQTGGSEAAAARRALERLFVEISRQEA